MKQENDNVSLETVREYMAQHAPDIFVDVHELSTATVAEAAATIGVLPGQIAKTLSVRVGDAVIILVVRGDCRLDNRKFKDAFGEKPRMLPLDDVVALTGHPVGGVCPFGLAQDLPVYCDVSLKDFDEVFPAAGAVNASLRITPARLADITQAKWVDVCQRQET